MFPRGGANLSALLAQHAQENVLVRGDKGHRSPFALPARLAGSLAPLDDPLGRSWLVTCVRLENSDFDEEGPEAILGPEKALSKARPLP